MNQEGKSAEVVSTKEVPLHEPEATIVELSDTELDTVSGAGGPPKPSTGRAY